MSCNALSSGSTNYIFLTSGNFFDTYGRRLHFSTVSAGLLQLGTRLHKPAGFDKGLHCSDEAHRDHTGRMKNNFVDQLRSGNSGMDHWDL